MTSSGTNRMRLTPRTPDDRLQRPERMGVDGIVLLVLSCLQDARRKKRYRKSFHSHSSQTDGEVFDLLVYPGNRGLNLSEGIFDFHGCQPLSFDFMGYPTDLLVYLFGLVFHLDKRGLQFDYGICYGLGFPQRLVDK
ncbi:hypothetical protein OUZ56_009950 [Daphnia magna]|uniref:Uncharacterized protein n=1 Tax=Daphnia magna TaxID=35525 RepID=A0ABR0AHD2_9CRUS|nr:hypothetical protein OUZ56_009950 [Daphnia magna]